jgi:hypothetical protein
MENQEKNSIKKIKENLNKGKRVNSTDLEELVQKEYTETIKE